MSVIKAAPTNLLLIIKKKKKKKKSEYTAEMPSFSASNGLKQKLDNVMITENNQITEDIKVCGTKGKCLLYRRIDIITSDEISIQIKYFGCNVINKINITYVFVYFIKQEHIIIYTS